MFLRLKDLSGEPKSFNGDGFPANLHRTLKIKKKKKLEQGIISSWQEAGQEEIIMLS